MGGASVLLRKPRSQHEIIADVDDEIVNLFTSLRDQGVELIRRLHLTPFSRAEFETAYSPAEHPIERARRTMVRSQLAFGGGGVFRKSGFRGRCPTRSTSFAKAWQTLPEEMTAVVERLRGVVIERRAALDLIDMHDDRDALFYCDPPYLPETRQAPKVYRHELTPADHVALLNRLRKVRGKVVLSGYPSPIYDEMLSTWQRVEIRAMADAGKTNARERKEVLWIKS